MTRLTRKSRGIATALSLGVAMATFGSVAQAATCSYSISNEWSTGYTGTITIDNTDSSALNGWNVNWQYNTNRITSSWNANVSGSNPYSASDLGWNGNISPGQVVEFGFQVDKNGGSAETPSVNGTVCSSSGTGTSSSEPPSSANDTSSISSSPAAGQQCNWYGTLY